ncbi:MAG: hypothetical protein LC135_16595 [Phycisphaerae bacterium]|nr:hypothetical protein [Phycisphaerae bacterium]MCZ2401459.1 hypothetical protein [Phycisphaerae bacterium]NUQ47867.1 hypothetical protein [Phycisphaerae bacterium]
MSFRCHVGPVLARLASLPVAAVLVAGCPQTPGLADQDPNDTTPDAVAVTQNTAPVASAGDDLVVFSGDFVVLDGAASFDPDGDRIVFIWRQVTESPEVTLIDGFSSRPRFFAPAVATGAVVTFRLTVVDGFAVATDDVTVTILPAVQ